MLRQVLFYFIVVFIAGSKANLGCIDEKGNPVDWFFVYKLPQNTDPSLSFQDGLSYLFITSNDSKGWIISDRKINGLTSIIAQTIGPMYSYNHRHSEELWLAYNDQERPKPHRSHDGSTPRPINPYGHTKGVVGADANGGFWLVHSVPHFPGTASYDFPDTGRRYGQSAVCVSLNPSNIDLVGEILQLNTPNFFKVSLNDSMAKLYPNLVKASKGYKPTSSNKSVIIQTKEDVKFHAFGKSSKFGKDLYEWVASSFLTDLYAETWLNEPQVLPSSCNLSYKVMNVQMIRIEEARVKFSTHKDHSKWAVSASREKPWLCVGDINRAVPQEMRGGGTLCVSNSAVWNAYKGTIGAASECSPTYRERNEVSGSEKR